MDLTGRADLLACWLRASVAIETARDTVMENGGHIEGGERQDNGAGGHPPR